MKALDKTDYFAKLLFLFNNERPVDCALFAFIINHAEYGYYKIEEEAGNDVFTCKLTPEAGELEIDKVFAERVRKVSQLFRINDVVFSDRDYSFFLDIIDEDDCVMLDPPRPDFYEGAILTDQLLDDIHFLDQKNVAYLMFYGILGLDSPYHIKYPEGHIYRLTKNKNGPIVTHSFLSTSLIPYLDNSELPDTLQPCFHRIFESQAHINGDKQALSWDDSGTQEFYSYRELNQISNKLARLLMEKGLQKDHLVAIYLDRTPALIISMLAVMKSGAAYIPFEADPEKVSRSACLQSMKDSEIKFLMTSSIILNELRKSQDSDEKWKKIQKIELKDVFCQEITQSISDSSDLDLPIHRDDLVYVMNTSGSTGRPKGVEILHRGLPYAFSSHQNLLNIQTTDQIAQFGSVAFDASLMEMMMALGSGATLFLIAEDTYKDNRKLTAYLVNNKITIAIQTPKMLESLDPAKFPDLRTILIVGDKFNKLLSDQWIRTPIGERIIERQVINGYGLTETTICTTLEECSLEKPLSIGKEILGLKIFLRDKDEEVEQKVELINAKWLKPSHNDQELIVDGVIYIAGPCLARGYRGRQDLTAKAFKEIKINSREQILYNSGDVGHYQADGSIVITGRIGRQVKIRGQRVELDQVEEIVKEMKDLIMDARAIAYEVPGPNTGTSVENQIVLYLVPRNPAYVMKSKEREKANEEIVKQLIAIRKYIRANAHSSMVPAINNMKFIDDLHYKTSNDKGSWVDARLKEIQVPCIDMPVENEAALMDLSQPIRELLGWIRNVAGEVLNIKAETINFSINTLEDYGADSLKIFKCIKALDQRVDEQPEFTEVIQSITAPKLSHLTLKELGLYLQNFMHEINLAKEQKIKEEKAYGIGTKKRVQTSDFNINEETFYGKISIPFYVVHSLLGDAESDYGASIIKKITCSHEKLNTPSIETMTSWEKEKFFDHLADHHIAKMKKNEGAFQKIFWVLGWSSGGIVALKIAEKLRSEGKRVYLFLLDPTHPRSIQKMSSEKHVETLITIGDRLLSIAAGYAKYSEDLKVDCKDDLEAISNREEQAKFLFKYIIQKIDILKKDSGFQLSPQALRIIDKMIASARMIYAAELVLNQGFTLSNDDMLFFAKKSDAKNYWQSESNAQRIEIDGDHFQIVNSDQLKNEIDRALHKQFKIAVNDVSDGIRYLNYNDYKKASHCFEKALSNNPGDMRTQLMYIQSKLLLEEYAAVSDHISKLIPKIDSIKFCEVLKIYDSVAKNLLKDTPPVMKVKPKPTLKLSSFEKLCEASHAWKSQWNFRPDAFVKHVDFYKNGLATLLMYDSPLYENSKLEGYVAMIGDYLKQPSVLIAHSALLHENYPLAIQHFSKAITPSKLSSFAYAGRACAYCLSGHIQSALEDLDNGISLDPKNFNLLAIRGTIYYLLNQYDEAQKDLEEADTIHPGEDFILTMLMFSYHLINPLKSLEWSQKFIDHHSQEYHGYLTKGILHRELHEFDDAKKVLTDGIAKTLPTPSLYAERAQLHFQLNELQNAINDATEAIQLDAYSYDMLFLRSHIYLATEKVDKAIQDYYRCLQIQPNNSLIISLLQYAQILKITGFRPQAMANEIKRVHELLHKNNISRTTFRSNFYIKINEIMHKGGMNPKDISIMMNLFTDNTFEKPDSDLNRSPTSFMGTTNEEKKTRSPTEIDQFPSAEKTQNYNTFHCTGKTFVIIPTVGDGACALHAMLGTFGKQQIFFAAAKTKYVEAFKRNFENVRIFWGNCMFGMLKEYVSLGGGSTDVRMIFNQIPDVIRLLRSVLDSLDSQRNQRLNEQAVCFEKALKMDENTVNQLFAIFKLSAGDKIRLINDPEFRNNVFRSNLEEVLVVLKDDVVLQTFKAKLAKIEEDRDTILKAYIQYPIFKDVYMNACVESSYYFSDEEIGIAATLFNKKVHIYSQVADTVRGPIEYGDSSDTIVIYHNGNHYSRCEPKLGGS